MIFGLFPPARLPVLPAPRRRRRCQPLAPEPDQLRAAGPLRTKPDQHRLIEQRYDDLQRLAGSLLQRHTTASQLVRALRSKTRHLASLACALQHVGRVAKTAHLLDYCNDAPFRRRILTQLNRGESRHGLCREVCHGYRGELRQRYRDGQEEQLGALGLITSAIVLYNTIYTQRALDHLQSTGQQIDEGDVARLTPLGSEHLTLTGRYRVALNAALRDRTAYRELNTSPARRPR